MKHSPTDLPVVNLNGYLDWSQAPLIYQQAFPEASHQLRVLHEFDFEPHDDGDWKDRHFFLLYVYPIEDGITLRLVTDFDISLFSRKKVKDIDELVDFALPLGIAYVLAMMLLLYLFNRRISRQSQAMADWATQLSLDNFGDSHPDFRYFEFNSMASQLRSAFERIGNLLERERQFLRHASHELRTPIAVTRTNIDLLYRLGVPDNIEEPIERVKRANQNMHQLTETLLWLGREEEQTPSSQTVVLVELIDSVVDELRYLLEGKSVELSYDYAGAGALRLPKMPLRIVLANLVRNAFQYNQAGKVSIVLESGRIVITNREDDKSVNDKDESFGLGLNLVRQICARLDWSLDIDFGEQGAQATLVLPRRGTGVSEAKD